MNAAIREVKMKGGFLRAVDRKCGVPRITVMFRMNDEFTKTRIEEVLQL